METSNFKEYLKSIAEYPLLNADEEIELGRRIKEGDEEARQDLINSNLRLVVAVAKKYTASNLSLEDLVMEGSIGLMTAVSKFDPERKFRFSTCAVPWIKQAISKAIQENSRNIRLPAHIYQSLNQLKKALDQLATEGNTKPTAADIAKVMNIEVDEVERLLDYRKDTVSLSLSLGDDTEDTLEDLQADTADESPVEYTERHERADQVAAMIRGLDERTQVIIKMRYGLGQPGDPEDWQNEHTLEEIGAYLGITRERVRQIEKQTLQELKLKYSKQ